MDATALPTLLPSELIPPAAHNRARSSQHDNGRQNDKQEVESGEGWAQTEQTAEQAQMHSPHAAQPRSPTLDTTDSWHLTDGATTEQPANQTQQQHQQQQHQQQQPGRDTSHPNLLQTEELPTTSCQSANTESSAKTSSDVSWVVPIIHVDESASRNTLGSSMSSSLGEGASATTFPGAIKVADDMFLDEIPDSTHQMESRSEGAVRLRSSISSSRSQIIARFSNLNISQNLRLSASNGNDNNNNATFPRPSATERASASSAAASSASAASSSAPPLPPLEQQVREAEAARDVVFPRPMYLCDVPEIAPFWQSRWWTMLKGDFVYHQIPGRLNKEAAAEYIATTQAERSAGNVSDSTGPQNRSSSSRRKQQQPSLVLHQLQSYEIPAYPSNSVMTARYNLVSFIPLQLFAQFCKIANLYFLFVSIIQMIPGWSPTGRSTTIIPLSIFTGLSMAREGYDDYRRHIQDSEENSRTTRVLRPKPRPSGEDAAIWAENPNNWEFKDVCWHEVCVGDIVRVEQDEEIPADMILLSVSKSENESVLPEEGTCYIETANLDGESNLKMKQSLKATNRLMSTVDGMVRSRGYVESELPNNRLYEYEGYVQIASNLQSPMPHVVARDPDLPKHALSPSQVILRGSRLRNTDFVHGLVIFTGDECKIRLNSNVPRTKAPRMQKLTNNTVICIFALIILLSSIFSVACVIQDQRVIKYSWYTVGQARNLPPVFFGYVILYNTMIPLSLYVTMEFVKLVQAFLIGQDMRMYDPKTNTPALARTSSLNEELGQVSFLFSDKTGTLTENVMVFKALSVGGHIYRDQETSSAKADPAESVDDDGTSVDDHENHGDDDDNAMSNELPKSLLNDLRNPDSSASASASAPQQNQKQKQQQNQQNQQDHQQHRYHHHHHYHQRDSIVAENESSHLLKTSSSFSNSDASDHRPSVDTAVDFSHKHSGAPAEAIASPDFPLLRSERATEKLPAAEPEWLPTLSEESQAVEMPIEDDESMLAPSCAPPLDGTLDSASMAAHSSHGGSPAFSLQYLRRMLADPRAKNRRAAAELLLAIALCHSVIPSHPRPPKQASSHLKDPKGKEDATQAFGKKTGTAAAIQNITRKTRRMSSLRDDSIDTLQQVNQHADNNLTKTSDCNENRVKISESNQSSANSRSGSNQHHGSNSESSPSRLADEIVYQASSPDELALVEAAAQLGFRLVRRARDSISLAIPSASCLELGLGSSLNDSLTLSSRRRENHQQQGTPQTAKTPMIHTNSNNANESVILTFILLANLEFSSSRKRMSIIVQELGSKKIRLITKGADSVIWERLRKVKDGFETHIRKDSIQKKDTTDNPTSYITTSSSSSSSSSTPSSSASSSQKKAAESHESKDVGQPHGSKICYTEAVQDCVFAATETLMIQPYLEETMRHTDLFATEGLRTLAYATRNVDEAEFQAWNRQHQAASIALQRRAELLEASAEKIERDLTVLGVTAIEDKLQDDVAATVRMLQKAGIRVWILTGDKRETAINVGKAAGVIPEDAELNWKASEPAAKKSEAMRQQPTSSPISSSAGKAGLLTQPPRKDSLYAGGSSSPGHASIARGHEEDACTPSSLSSSRVWQLIGNEAEIARALDQMEACMNAQQDYQDATFVEMTNGGLAHHDSLAGNGAQQSSWYPGWLRDRHSQRRHQLRLQRSINIAAMAAANTPPTLQDLTGHEPFYLYEYVLGRQDHSLKQFIHQNGELRLPIHFLQPANPNEAKRRWWKSANVSVFAPMPVRIASSTAAAGAAATSSARTNSQLAMAQSFNHDPLDQSAYRGEGGVLADGSARLTSFAGTPKQVAQITSPLIVSPNEKSQYSSVGVLIVNDSAERLRSSASLPSLPMYRFASDGNGLSSAPSAPHQQQYYHQQQLQDQQPLSLPASMGSTPNHVGNHSILSNIVEVFRPANSNQEILNYLSSGSRLTSDASVEAPVLAKAAFFTTDTDFVPERSSLSSLSRPIRSRQQQQQIQGSHVSLDQSQGQFDQFESDLQSGTDAQSSGRRPRSHSSTGFAVGESRANLDRARKHTLNVRWETGIASASATPPRRLSALGKRPVLFTPSPPPPPPPPSSSSATKTRTTITITTTISQRGGLNDSDVCTHTSANDDGASNDTAKQPKDPRISHSPLRNQLFRGENTVDADEHMYDEDMRLGATTADSQVRSLSHAAHVADGETPDDFDRDITFMQAAAAALAMQSDPSRLLLSISSSSQPSVPTIVSKPKSPRKSPRMMPTVPPSPRMSAPRSRTAPSSPQMLPTLELAPLRTRPLSSSANIFQLSQQPSANTSHVAAQSLCIEAAAMHENYATPVAEDQNMGSPQAMIPNRYFANQSRALRERTGTNNNKNDSKHTNRGHVDDATHTEKQVEKMNTDDNTKADGIRTTSNNYNNKNSNSSSGSSQSRGYALHGEQRGKLDDASNFGQQGALSPQSASCPSAMSSLAFASKKSMDAYPQQHREQDHAPQRPHNVVVIDGTALALIERIPKIVERFYRLCCRADSVILCRASPIQKANVVAAVRTIFPQKVTCAIGDGANDVSMLQEAHIGLGITGREGLQAARSSDYSIAQFRFLAPLLLVHGRWNYIRVSKFILGTFYKCMTFYLTQGVYQFMTGFSGTSLYEQWTLSFYNTLFSALPIICIGFLEKDLEADTLLTFPHLYRLGRLDEGFNLRLLFVELVQSVVHAVILVMLPVLMIRDPNNDSLRSDNNYYFGTVVYSCVVFVVTFKIGFVSSSYWTSLMLAACLGTVAIWMLYQEVYSLVWRVIPSFGVDNFGIMQILTADASFWFLLIVVTLCCLLPPVIIMMLEWEWSPTDVMLAREWQSERQQAEHWARSHLEKSSSPSATSTSVRKRRTSSLSRSRRKGGGDEMAPQVIGNVYAIDPSVALHHAR